MKVSPNLPPPQKLPRSLHRLRRRRPHHLPAFISSKFDIAVVRQDLLRLGLGGRAGVEGFALHGAVEKERAEEERGTGAVG